MPRRLITSQIFLNEKFGNLEDAGRLFFIGCFANADDDGRLKASPKYLKALIFPYDNNKDTDLVKQLRDRCHELGLIHVYSVNGYEFLYCIGWGEHQSIRRDRYIESKLPPPDGFDNQPTTTTHPNDNQPTTTQQPSADPNPIQSNISKVIYNIYSFWNEQQIIVHKKLTPDTQRAIEALLKDYKEQDIMQSIKNYAEIQKGEQYYFNYAWTLKDFLKRGLIKFLDLEIAKHNYFRGKNNAGTERPIKHQSDVKVLH